MLDVIRSLLKNSDLFLKKLEHIDKKIENYSIAASWTPFVKWNYSDTVADEYAFLLLLFIWINMQKQYSPIRPENKEKPTVNLLTELFGTTVFSELEIEKIKDSDLFQKLQTYVINDSEHAIKSMNNAIGLAITCKTGDILYFGKTALFYFLISKEYLKEYIPYIKKDIREILFDNKLCKSIKKRPGMFIGTLKRKGLYLLLFELIEDLLKDAAEKIISLKLLSQNVFEISCESYSVKNNTQYINPLTIASVLGEFFEYQDEQQRIRTEKGLLCASDYENVVSRGIKILWKADSSIFEDIDLDYFIIMNRMIELAACNPYKIYLSDCNNQNIIYIPSGIKNFLERDYSLFSLSEILSIDIFDVLFTGKVAISFSALNGDIRQGYVNSHITEDGGTHVEGLLEGAQKALKRILESYDTSLTPELFIENLNYVIHIQIENPKWYGSTKRKLTNIEVKTIVEKHVEKALYSFLKQDIGPLKSIYPSLF